jgi:heme-degrading monooxygenase HmoA
MEAAGDRSEPVAFDAGQVVTVFRSRRRQGSDAAYAEVALEMEAAARAAPGFVDFKTFVAEDGERASLVTFATPLSHQAWRDDARHRRAQQQGRDHFYLEYSIQVGECDHTTRWERTAD